MTHTPQLGTPQKRGAGWWVPSASGQWGYFVEVTAQTVRCTCPSFVHRRARLPRGECKHIQAVRKVVAMA